MSKSDEKIQRVIFQEGGVQVYGLGVKGSLEIKKDKCSLELRPGMLEVVTEKQHTLVPLSHVKQLDFAD